MEFREVVMSRYATKKFDGRKIPEQKVNELFEIIRFAPSAVNLQPWKIKVVTDQKVKEQLKPATNDQEQVTTCSHLLVFCANPDFDGLLKKDEALMKKSGVPEETRNFIIGMIKGMTGKMTAEQKLCWAKSQLFLALGNAVNGAKSLGFDSCPIGGFNPEEYTRILKIPPPLVPTMLCPIGYAADKPMPKARFAKEEIFF